jgi:DNA replication protein DnaC
MMTLSDLWTHFKLLTDPQDLSDSERSFLQRFLSEEQKLREKKRIEYLLRQSGIKRIKLLKEFDWTFNPKISRDKILEFLNTQWLKKPSNLVIIGPAGVGKTHIATALCYEAILQGFQTVFLTLFDLNAKLNKAKNLYTLIEYYARIPVLCLDELGYVIPTKEQADCIFQIFSKRTEVTTTLVTTNRLCGAPHNRFNAELIVMWRGVSREPTITQLFQ